MSAKNDSCAECQRWHEQFKRKLKDCMYWMTRAKDAEDHVRELEKAMRSAAQAFNRKVDGNGGKL